MKQCNTVKQRLQYRLHIMISEDLAYTLSPRALNIAFTISILFINTTCISSWHKSWHSLNTHIVVSRSGAIDLYIYINKNINVYIYIDSCTMIFVGMSYSAGGYLSSCSSSSGGKGTPTMSATSALWNHSVQAPSYKGTSL